MEFRFLSFLYLLLLLVRPASAQEVFEKDQVDLAAVPMGGSSALVDFIKHNIRTPFENKVEGIAGKVELKGIIELDGSMSSLQILKGLNPSSEEETVRIFSLFRAWVPAIKDDKPVRQFFNFTLQFGNEELTNFNRQTRQIEYYFDKGIKRVDNEDAAEYRLQVEVDENGIPVGSVGFSYKKKKNWADHQKYANDLVPLSRDMTAHLLGVDVSELSGYMENSEAFIAKATTEPFVIDLPEYIVSADKRIVRELLPGVYSKVYYASGQTARVKIFEGAKITQNIGWYPNSKIKEKYFSEVLENGLEVDKIISLFDSSGKALVRNGQGQIEGPGFKWGMGSVVDGYLSGIWTYVSADGSTIFEETYERGRFKGGKRRSNNEVFEYGSLAEEPEFKGGMERFYSHLARNIRYPPEAAKNKRQGRVLLSFFVDLNGEISDFSVDKGVEPSLDREALRVVALSSGNWVPGKQRGVPVRMKYTIPVNFRLE